MLATEGNRGSAATGAEFLQETGLPYPSAGNLLSNEIWDLSKDLPLGLRGDSEIRRRHVEHIKEMAMLKYDLEKQQCITQIAKLKRDQEGVRFGATGM